MKLDDIKLQMDQTISKVISEMQEYDETTFFEPMGNKWSPAGHYLHLIQSVKPFNAALKAPKLALWWKFGKNKNSVRTYDELVAYYRSLPVPSRTGFEPRFKDHMSKSYLIEAFQKHHNEMLKSLENWSDKSTESYVLPHPLMGKISIKELLFFMNHHINHHNLATKK
jgi:hypothetical protein